MSFCMTVELCTGQTAVSGLCSLVSGIRSEISHALPLVDNSCMEKPWMRVEKPLVHQDLTSDNIL